MSHQGPPDDPHGNERRPSPHSDQTYMNPNHGGPSMQPHPQTVPFGSIPQNSLPQPSGDPSMFAWGAPPYAMPHGMQQGHPQYPQYPTHHQPFIAPPGPHYAAPPGMPTGQPPYGQQQPYPAHHQGQMYPYPYPHPGQQIHHHVQPEQPTQLQAELGVPNSSLASPIVPPPDNAVGQVGLNPSKATLTHQGSPSTDQDVSQDPKNQSDTNEDKTNQSNLEADDGPVAKDEIFRFAVQLVGPKAKNETRKTEVPLNDETSQQPQGHPFFAPRENSPDILSYKVTPLSTHTIGGHHDQVYARHTPSCHCRRPISRGMDSSPEKKNVCLKLYCECFAYGAMCSDRCACSSACFNTSQHSVERAQAVGSILQEDPNGFRRDMDWMTDLQRSCRNDYVLPKERKGMVSISKMDHEAITDDSLRIAKLPPNRYTMDLKGNNGVIYRALAFSLTHPKLHRRRRKSKVPPVCPASMERIGYPEFELVANLECKKVDELFKKALSQVDQAVHNLSATKDQKKVARLPNPTIPIDSLLAEHLADELTEARATATSVREFVSATYFEGPNLKRKAAEALGFEPDVDESKSTANKAAAEDGIGCIESLPQCTLKENGQELKDLILRVSEDTAIIQHTASAIKSIARRLARRRVR